MLKKRKVTLKNQAKTNKKFIVILINCEPLRWPLFKGLKCSYSNKLLAFKT